MTTSYPLQNNFSGGELSPRMGARVNTEFYEKALAMARNWVGTPQGSAIKRPGMEFQRQTHQNTPARLIQFAQSRGEDYVVEIGAGYIRMLNREGVVQKSGAEALLNREFKQGGDGLRHWDLTTFFTRELIQPPETIEITVMEYSITSPQFRVTALPQAQSPNNWARLDQSTTVVSGLQYSFRLDFGLDGWPYNEFQLIVQIGDGTNFTAYADEIYTTPGTKEILFTPTTTTATVRIRFQLANTPTQAPTWAYVEDLRLRPATDDPLIITTGDPVNSSVPWTAEEIFQLDVAMDLGGDPTNRDRLFIFHEKHPPHLLFRVSENDWQCVDLVNGAQPSPKFTDPPAQWVAGNYPGTGELFSGRLWVSGTPNERSRLWASKAGNYFVFTAGANAGDPLDLELVTRGAIEWIRGQKALLLGTDLAEHLISGSQSLRAVGVGDIDVEEQSGHGSAPYIQPEIIGNEVVYVNPDRTKLYAMDYLRDADGWVSTDLSWAAEHITRERINAFAWARDPNNQLILLMDDGTVRVCIYDRIFGTLGWWRWGTGPEAGPVVGAGQVPAENAYDDFLRNNIAPRLWIQGKDGMVNAGAAGAITVTGYFVGEEAFSITNPDGGHTGAGSDVDPSGGSIQQLISTDFSKWNDQGRGITTLSNDSEGRVDVRLEGAPLNNPAFGFLQILTGTRPARGGWEYAYFGEMTDSYALTGGQGLSSIRLWDPTQDIFEWTNELAPDNLPRTWQGQTVHPTGVSASYNFDTGYNAAYDGNAGVPTWYLAKIKLEGHGGGCWTWPENTWVADSDYSLGIIYDWDDKRFGLQAPDIQTVYQAGQDFWVRFDAGVLKVDQGNPVQTYTLGALTGHIVITYNKTSGDLKAYQDGVLMITVPSAVAPDPAVWTIEGVGARNSFNTTFAPLVNPFQHFWHINSVVNDATIADLFNAVPPSASVVDTSAHQVLSLCATNDVGGSSPWYCVKRGGNYYVETQQAGEVNTQYMDAWVRRTTVNKEVTGLEHLNNQVVQVLVNGAIEPDQVVIDGKITTQADGEAVVGLRYDAQLLTLRPEAGNPAGTSQVAEMNFNEVHLRLHDSAVPMVNGQRPALRDPQTPMNTPTPLMSGDSVTTDIQNGTKGQLNIEQDLPLRTEIVAIYGKLDTQML